MNTPNFNNACVLSFESRLADVMALQIKKFGGRPLVVPALQELPLTDNPEAFAFVDQLLNDEIDGVVFMTGVGANYLFNIIETKYHLNDVLAKLNDVLIITRGPKPVKVLRERNIGVDINAPEPNTWREVLASIDEYQEQVSIQGKTIAVQEYGVSNDQFEDELVKRGAEVVAVPAYRWGLPSDITSIKEAINATIRGEVDLLFITSAIQIHHVMQVAQQIDLKDQFISALSNVAICSIGPMASEGLESYGLSIAFTPSHPKQGTLVAEAAKAASDLIKK